MTTETLLHNTMPPEIAAGIVKVQASVKKLAKTSENKFQRYNYASIDDFLEAIGPLEADAGIFLLCEEEAEETIERAHKDRESGSDWLKVRWAFTIGHASGALYGPLHRTVMVPAVGAQAYGSAQSYALKQFQRGLYKIPTGDGDDPDSQEAKPLPIGRSRANGTQKPAQTGKPVTTQPKGAAAIPVKRWADMTYEERKLYAISRIDAAKRIADPVQAHAALRKIADGIKPGELDQDGMDAVAEAMLAADGEITAPAGESQ